MKRRSKKENGNEEKCVLSGVRPTATAIENIKAASQASTEATSKDDVDRNRTA